jgi:shikimate dehydrogenase
VTEITPPTDIVPARSFANGESVLLGLIGEGISASMSPRLHEHEAASNGLLCVYKIIDLAQLGLDPDNLPELLLAAERMGFVGLNITHPCKQRVVPLLDELSDDARTLDAVNTVLLREGRRIGHNTDLYGFAQNLRRFLPDAPLHHIVQFGAGGAGAAVAHAVLRAGTQQLTIIDVDVERSARLVGKLTDSFGPARAQLSIDAEEAMSTANGVINTTPIGMVGHPGSPLPASFLRPDLWVADIVYFPLDTDLIRAADQAGCRTLSGAGMVVFQAAEAFRLFTGVAPDVARMLRHFAELSACRPRKKRRRKSCLK